MRLFVRHCCGYSVQGLVWHWCVLGWQLVYLVWLLKAGFVAGGWEGSLLRLLSAARHVSIYTPRSRLLSQSANTQSVII